MVGNKGEIARWWPLLPMKEEVIIHFAIAAPVEPLLNSQAAYSFLHWTAESALNLTWRLCSTYPGHSIRGTWPVYFAAICSTLQPRKGPVHHSVSPHVWPLRMEKGAKRQGVETAASSNPGFVESGRERSRTLCNVGKRGGSTKRQRGKESIYSWPVSCVKLRISEFSTEALD